MNVVSAEHPVAYLCVLAFVFGSLIASFVLYVVIGDHTLGLLVGIPFMVVGGIALGSVVA